MTAVMNSRISDLDRCGLRRHHRRAATLQSRVPANEATSQNATTVIPGPNNSTTLTGCSQRQPPNGNRNRHRHPAAHSVWWKWAARRGRPVTVDTRQLLRHRTRGHTGTALEQPWTIGNNDDINVCAQHRVPIGRRLGGDTAKLSSQTSPSPPSRPASRHCRRRDRVL